jgi:hypothetical protein
MKRHKEKRILFEVMIGQSFSLLTSEGVRIHLPDDLNLQDDDIIRSIFESIFRFDLNQRLVAEGSMGDTVIYENGQIELIGFCE